MLQRICVIIGSKFHLVISFNDHQEIDEYNVIKSYMGVIFIHEFNTV